MTAEPVGSRALVKRYALELSPATVRNTMADLEEDGYLQQLHTSSGRVPTDKGYRYYVDYLMRVQELTLGERARIEEELSNKLNDTDEVMRRTSHLLALISHQTGIVEAPDGAGVEVRRIELMPVDPSRMAVMVADNYGRVRTMVVSHDEDLPASEVERMGRFLNDHCRGASSGNLADALRTQLDSFMDEQRQLAERAVRILDLVPGRRHAEFFLEGATQLFEQPEFRDVREVRKVFSLLEERDRLAELLRVALQEGKPAQTTVVIGSEMSDSGLKEVSIVASPYCVGDERVGVVGVLGPRRMNYPRLTALVEYTSSLLSRCLTGNSR